MLALVLRVRTEGHRTCLARSWLFVRSGRTAFPREVCGTAGPITGRPWRAGAGPRRSSAGDRPAYCGWPRATGKGAALCRRRAGPRSAWCRTSPGEVRSLWGGCAGLWMNCANTQDGDAMPRDVPGAALSARPANYQRKCGWLDGLREDQEGGRNRAGTRWLSTRDLWMGSQASADIASSSRPATDRSHWLVLSIGLVPEPVAAGPARVSGPGGRTVPAAGRTGPMRPFRSRWAWCNPHLSLSAQMMCSLRPVSVEGAGRPRRRSGRAGVGDRAQHPGPGLQQAEPDRPPGPGYRRVRAGRAAARWSAAQIPRSRCLGCVLPCPTGAGCDGEVPGGADRSGIRAERARGDPRQPGPAREGGIR